MSEPSGNTNQRLIYQTVSEILFSKVGIGNYVIMIWRPETIICGKVNHVDCPVRPRPPTRRRWAIKNNGIFVFEYFLTNIRLRNYYSAFFSRQQQRLLSVIPTWHNDEAACSQPSATNPAEVQLEEKFEEKFFNRPKWLEEKFSSRPKRRLIGLPS